MFGEQPSLITGASSQEGKESHLFFPEANAYQRIKIFFERYGLISNLPEKIDYIGNKYKRSLVEIFRYLRDNSINFYKRETINYLEDRKNRENLSQINQGDYVFFRTFLPGQHEDIPVLVFGKVIEIDEKDDVKKIIFRKNSYFVISPSIIGLNDKDYQIHSQTINNIFPNIINSEKIFLIGQIKSEEVDQVEDFLFLMRFIDF